MQERKVLARKEPTALVVDAIRRYGARILSLICRVTKTPVETVRYKVKKQLADMGFRISIALDSNRLGATKTFAEIGLDEEKVPAEKFFEALSRASLLTYCGKKLGEDGFVTMFWVPNSVSAEFQQLMKLVRIGMIHDFRSWFSGLLVMKQVRLLYFDQRTLHGLEGYLNYGCVIW